MGNKNLTLLEETEEYLYGLRVWKDFLNNSQKNTNKGGKRWIDLTTLKFKHLCASKDTINKVKKRSHRPGEGIYNTYNQKL